MHAIILSALAAMALGQEGIGKRPAETPREAHMAHCLVSLIDEAQIPAEERGVLTELNVHEGASVMKGDLLAQIDDRDVQMARRVAELELAVSDEEARNDVEIRYARAAAAVAKAEWDEALQANRKQGGVYSDAEVRRLELNYDKLNLQIEQAQMGQRVKGLTNNVKQAELEATDLAISKRRIDSPLDGIVVERYRHAGEWVNPGEPIVRIVRMDKLRVEGFLRPDEFLPHEVLGREVTIDVKLARGQSAQFKSRISYVSPLVDSNGYRVWTEVTNTAPGGFWLIGPGMTAEMTIQVR